MSHDRVSPVDTLMQWEKQWRTSLGGWFPGERVVVRGKDLFTELGEQGWMSLLLYSITGKQFDEWQLQLFDGIWTLCTSFPDPRLWPNRIGALAGTARSTPVLGLGAGIAVSEAIIYGHRPLVAAMNFLQRVERECCQQSERDPAQKIKSLEALLIRVLASPCRGRPGGGKNRQVARLPGYGRPIVARDERIAPLLTLAKKLSFDRGRHVLLARSIEATLQNMGQDYRMNIAALMGGLCADQGLTPRQYYHYIGLCFSVGILACAADAEQQPEGAFFPLRCDRIHYQGAAQRRWVQSGADPTNQQEFTGKPKATNAEISSCP